MRNDINNPVNNNEKVIIKAGFQRFCNSPKVFLFKLLSPFVSLLFVFILLLSTSFLVIYFTPLKEYFRGYTSVELRENSIENALKLDSLETLYLKQSRYINALKDMLAGNISFEDNFKPN